MEGSCLEAEETDLDTGAQPAVTSSRSECEVLPLTRGWRLRPGIGALTLVVGSVRDIRLMTVGLGNRCCLASWLGSSHYCLLCVHCCQS